MSKIEEPLERKRSLLKRMQEQADPERLAEIERGLKEIDETLNRLESEELDAPVAAQAAAARRGLRSGGHSGQVSLIEPSTSSMAATASSGETLDGGF